MLQTYYKPVIPKRRAASSPRPCREATVPHGSKYKANIDSSCCGQLWCCGQRQVLLPKGIATVSLPSAIGVARGCKVAIPPTFLEHMVILCFERRFSKQNSVISLK